MDDISISILDTIFAIKDLASGGGGKYYCQPPISE
jgi:hypothetical protein